MTHPSVTPARVTRADILAMWPSLRQLAAIVINAGPRKAWAERATILRLAWRIARIRVELLILVWR